MGDVVLCAPPCAPPPCSSPHHGHAEVAACEQQPLQARDVHMVERCMQVHLPPQLLHPALCKH